MKNVFYFLLGVSLIVLTSATTASIMTVTPAKPKSVIVTYGTASNIQSTVNMYVRQGYQVKLIEGTHYESEIMLVMEKY